MTLPHTTVADALHRIRRGEMVIVVDGPDREDEGDLTMAARHVTPEALTFMIRQAGGLICVPCDGDRLDALGFEPMVADCGDGAAFTVSVDHRDCGSGISASDRTCTIRAMLDPDARPADFARPGHIFPLRARAGGVLERPGHTEAGVDLARLAGLEPCAVICEVLNDDGSVARRDDLERFSAVHGFPIMSIEELIAYRMSRDPIRASLSDARIAHG
jgi:3,4-dihydroxy 2-butanone 4-phosphate synthase/GTP cyclohydrolase II